MPCLVGTAMHCCATVTRVPNQVNSKLDKQDSKLDHIISLATTVSQAHRALRVEQQPPSKYATIPPEVQYRDPRCESTPARLTRMTRYHVASAGAQAPTPTRVYACGLTYEDSKLSCPAQGPCRLHGVYRIPIWGTSKMYFWW